MFPALDKKLQTTVCAENFLVQSENFLRMFTEKFLKEVYVPCTIHTKQNNRLKLSLHQVYAFVQLQVSCAFVRTRTKYVIEVARFLNFFVVVVG